MRLATIDLGTNTVRLLVADLEPGARNWRLVETDQQVTRLGEGLAATGWLGDVAAARTAAVVANYVTRARHAGAARIAVVATSAVREAANGRQFADGLERTTGERVAIVGGDEEAALTLAGVVEGLGGASALPGTTVVFDIGGGSTEYIVARGRALLAAVSLRLGVVDLAERYPFPGPVDGPRYRLMYGGVLDRLRREVPEAVRLARADRLVGSAGTVTTLGALDLGLTVYDPARIQGHVLSRGRIERLLARLARLTVAERGGLPCLEPGRADLIIPGVAIVLATLELIGLDRLVVSDWGLREGILLGLVT